MSSRDKEEPQEQAAALKEQRLVDEEKQGSKFCGCCDMRRAVIILNVLYLIYVVIGIALIATGIYLTIKTGGDTDENNQQQYDAYLEHVKPYNITLMVSAAISVVVTILALVGAERFSYGLVLPKAVWLVIHYFIQLIADIGGCNSWNKDVVPLDPEQQQCTIPWLGLVIGALVMIFVLSAHIGYLNEVSRGTMKRETYQREKHSCCCV